MVVRAAWIPSFGTITVGETNEPFNPTLGALFHSPLSPDESNTAAEKSPPSPTTAKALLEREGKGVLETFLNVASMCNLAKVEKKKEEEGEEEQWSARGDPTECAIQVLAHRFEWGRERWVEGAIPEWGRFLAPTILFAAFYPATDT